MSILKYLAANRAKLLKTILCYLSYLGFGAVSTLLGSSLFDLQLRMDVSFAKASSLIPSRSIGFLIGGLISGFIDAFLEPDMVLFLCHLICALFTTAVPWFKSYSAIYACFFVSGIAQGILEIFVNACVLSIWNDDAMNYIQMLHGVYGIGSLLAPLVVKPFLLLQVTESNITEIEDPIIVSYTADDVKVQYPYLIFGLIVFLAALGFLYYYLKNRSNLSVKTDESTNKDTQSKWKKILVVLIGALIAHTTFSVNATTASLAPAFVVKSDLKMTKQDGADLVSTYWAVFTCYRLLFIIVTNYVEKRFLIIFNCLLTLASAVLMFLYAAQSRTFAWLSFIMLAIGFSPTFAASLGFIQEYIFITRRYASIIFLIGALGDTLHPWIITGFMDKTPEIFASYVSCLALIQTSAVLILPFVCAKLFKNKTEGTFDRTSSLRISQR